MVQGTKVVGTGAVAVGSGVVQGTKAAGRATVTAGKAVVDTGAMIGSATVEGKPKVLNYIVTGASSVENWISWTP